MKRKDGLCPDCAARKRNPNHAYCNECRSARQRLFRSGIRIVCAGNTITINKHGKMLMRYIVKSEQHIKQMQRRVRMVWYNQKPKPSPKTAYIDQDRTIVLVSEDGNEKRLRVTAGEQHIRLASLAKRYGYQITERRAT